MEKLTILFDTPQKMAAYLTDNPQLQDFLESFLSLKSLEERKVFEHNFWANVTKCPATEQAAIRASNAKITERLRERMDNMTANPHQLVDRRESAFQN